MRTRLWLQYVSPKPWTFRRMDISSNGQSNGQSNGHFVEFFFRIVNFVEGYFAESALTIRYKENKKWSKNKFSLNYFMFWNIMILLFLFKLKTNFPYGVPWNDR
ncbi:unnamed protein product [Rhizophagus irregularis]|nr:unnamed protein product [Rhizophagus irregularis]